MGKETKDDRVRRIAHETYTENHDPHDVDVQEDARIEKVDGGGYWVAARLWVPALDDD